MDVSPYLRKPLRSLQEVVEARKPQTATADAAEAASADAASRPPTAEISLDG